MMQLGYHRYLSAAQEMHRKWEDQERSYAAMMPRSLWVLRAICESTVDNAEQGEDVTLGMHYTQ